MYLQTVCRHGRRLHRNKAKSIDKRGGKGAEHSSQYGIVGHEEHDHHDHKYEVNAIRRQIQETFMGLVLGSQLDT